MIHSPGFLEAVRDAKSRVKENTPEDVQHKLAAGESFYFIDVREDDEWKKGRAKGAIHLGKGIIERDIETTIPDHEAEIILYCGGGFRSALAADALQKMGYKNVISMDGGWKRWNELGYSTEKD
jgi:rhodanese-related sulfurtransferase